MKAQSSRREAQAQETILVVDDEVLIRMQLADYLRECGYRVLEAANADEAIAVLQAEQDVDLVFTDVQMPGSTDGFGLARWVRSNRPGTKVILTSGVARSCAVAGELCADGPVEEKPYHPGQLLERIRQTLAQARRPRNQSPETDQFGFRLRALRNAG